MSTMNTKEFFSVWKEVFSKSRYIFYAVLVAVVFYFANVLIVNYQNLGSVYSLSGFSGVLFSLPGFFLGFSYLLTRESFVTLILVSLLLGILLGLIFYRIKTIKVASGTFGFLPALGIFLGILAPGCTACGLGLLPFLGIGTAILVSLPLKGLEISILAVIVLSFSTFKITKDIHNGIFCEIPKKPKKAEQKSKKLKKKF